MGNDLIAAFKINHVKFGEKSCIFAAESITCKKKPALVCSLITDLYSVAYFLKMNAKCSFIGVVFIFTFLLQLNSPVSYCSCESLNVTPILNALSHCQDLEQSTEWEFLHESWYVCFCVLGSEQNQFGVFVFTSITILFILFHTICSCVCRSRAGLHKSIFWVLKLWVYDLQGLFNNGLTRFYNTQQTI